MYPLCCRFGWLASSRMCSCVIMRSLRTPKSKWSVLTNNTKYLGKLPLDDDEPEKKRDLPASTTWYIGRRSYGEPRKAVTRHGPGHRSGIHRLPCTKLGPQRYSHHHNRGHFTRWAARAQNVISDDPGRVSRCLAEINHYFNPRRY